MIAADCEHAPPRRLKILSIASACPYPPDGGTRILIYRQVRELATHHDVDLVAVDCLSDGGFDPSVPLGTTGLSFCRSVHLIPLPERERSFSFHEKIGLTLRSGAPFFLYQRYSEDAQRLVDRLVAENAYDVIIAEDNEAGMYVRPSHRPRKILTKHAILSLQRTQLAGINPSRINAVRDRIYARLLRAYERREGALFDLIKLLTPDDLRRWRQNCPAGRVAVITNGVDTDFFPFAVRSGIVDRLIFTGVLTGAPNRDAVLTFLTEIYPSVVREIGPVPFYVVGKDPPPAIHGAARALPGVTVTGTVHDVRPYYGTKPIAVVPLRVASGIINKLLEPMALGVAVVTSSAAAVGLEIDPGEVCLVADTPADFTAAIVRLYRDPELYTRLTQAAYRYVLARHSWPQLMTNYRQTIEHLTCEERSPAISGSAAAAGRGAAACARADDQRLADATS